MRDTKSFSPNKRPASVIIQMKDGKIYDAYRELRRGDPEDPFTWEGLYQRMRVFAPKMNDQSAERIAVWSKGFQDVAEDNNVCKISGDLFSN